ncbi:MAG: HAMP domain-containing histidine kinase [Chloroflexia bacterium]|nr:HAMP domain-containing histidine kinase [Chloroflexia bacterium]
MLSIRWRLTLFHAAAILVVAAVLIGILAVVAIRGVQTSVEETARARAVEAVGLLESGVPPTDQALAGLTEGSVYLLIRDGRGRAMANVGVPSSDIDAVGADVRDAVWRDVLATGQPVTRGPEEMYVYAAPVAVGRSDARVVEAWKSYDDFGGNILPFATFTVVAVPAGLLLAIVGSYLLARSALSPVDAIVRSARAITESDLARRLPVQRPRDELGRLASTFNDLLARLEVAFRQRDETLTQQRRFVADASHELRTPLTSIQGYARMLDQWALDDPATARESVAAIRREAERMEALVEALLRLARGDEGAPLTLTTTDLRDLATEVIGSVRTGAGQSVALTESLPDTPVRATVDRAAIAQAVAILLDNAVKYTPAGGRVTLSIGRTGNVTEIAVTDTGIGIAPTHLPHIFDRFYRVDAARGAGGTGLGLAIARQIAERYDGTIAVASTPGEGSTFTLRLPAAGDDTALDPPN